MDANDSYDDADSGFEEADEAGLDGLDGGADDLADASDDLAEMVCPKCGESVTEDTQKCPHCGDWITPADPASGGVRRWILVAVVLLMIALALMWVR